MFFSCGKRLTNLEEKNLSVDRSIKLNDKHIDAIERHIDLHHVTFNRMQAEINLLKDSIKDLLRQLSVSQFRMQEQINRLTPSGQIQPTLALSE